MRDVVLTAAVIVGTIAVTTIAHHQLYRQEPASEATVNSLVAGSRVMLTPQQVAQTRSPALWPQPVKSLLAIDHPLLPGEWRWDDKGVPPGQAAVRIDLTTQLISVTRRGYEIGTAVVLYGADKGHATPLGHFSILSKSSNYRSLSYDAPMPYALRLTADGVALHGSDVRAGRATHGCVGLPLAFAHRLFDQMRVGDAVLIMRT